MMARPGATLALLAALCMAAANALRPGLPDILAAPWEGCEMRKARKACLGYKGCAWCTVTGEDEALCFGAATAAKLPPTVFKCTPADDAATAVATKPEPPATWEVCEAYSKAECAAHEDRCSLCTSLKGKALCFDPKTAAKLPPYIFHCTGGKGAGEGTVATQQADPPAPWEVCEAWNATECADHEDSCSLCTDLEGKQLCFEPFIAAKLPPFIFKCTGPPPPAPAAVAAVAKPKPWAICEAYNATECADHEDSCSLCTTPKGKQLCFDPSIAAKLPPSIFKCTGLPPPAPATASLVTMDGPRPWPACEKYDGDECEEHKSMCARCSTPKGKPLCFDPFIAAKLPDFIFHCKFPEHWEVSTS